MIILRKNDIEPVLELDTIENIYSNAAFIKFFLRTEEKSISDIFGHMPDPNYIYPADAKMT